MKENALVLGRCPLKYLRVKSHDTCHTFSVGTKRGLYMRVEFLNHGPSDVWTGTTQGLSVHRRMSGCIPGLHPLEAGHTLPSL